MTWMGWRSKIKLIFFATCLFVVLYRGSAVEESVILKSSMEILFANFEVLDPENGKSVRDKMLSNLLQDEDDEKVADKFHAMVADLHKEGSPQLRSAVVNFNSSIQNVEPEELKEILEELQQEASEKRKKRQDDDSTTRPTVSFTLKDVPRAKVSTKNKTEGKPYSTNYLFDLFLKQNHSEDEIDKIHKEFHDPNFAGKFEEINQVNVKPKGILGMILQKNHSEQFVEKLHRDFHKPEKVCTGTKTSKSDDVDETEEDDDEDKNEDENMIIRVEPEDDFQIFKK